MTDYNENIVKATLALVHAHRNSDRHDDLYDKYEIADYIWEELNEEVIDLVQAILEADDFGAMMNGLPINDKSDVKEHYKGLDNLIHNLPEEVKKAEQLDRVSHEIEALPNLLNNAFEQGFNGKQD